MGLEPTTARLGVEPIPLPEGTAGGGRGCGRGRAFAARERTNTVAVGYWIWGKLWRHITRSHKGSYKGRLGESSLRARVLPAHRILQGPPRESFFLESNQTFPCVQVRRGLFKAYPHL